MLHLTEDAANAVTQLNEICWTKTAEEIAELEAQLFLLGLTKLADFVRLAGLGNCGEEYPPLYFKALQAKFE